MVRLDCNGNEVIEGVGQVNCTLQGYSGAEPSASLSVSAPDATTTWPATHVLPDPRVRFVADESGGGVWLISVVVLDDLSCNAPTTLELTVTADEVTYGAAIQVLDNDSSIVLISGWWRQCYEPMMPSVSVVDAEASEADEDVTFVVNVSAPIGQSRRLPWPGGRS